MRSMQRLPQVRRASERVRLGCVACALAASAVAGAFAPGSARAEDSFAIAVLPDTQQETVSTGPYFSHRAQWLVNNKAALNLKFMLQVGDMMNWDTPDHIMYVRASNGLAILDAAGLPYATALGNHDTAAVKEGGSAAPGNVNTNLRNTTTYNAYFPPSRYMRYVAGSEAGKIDNAYHTFQAGGLDWLVINLELWPRATHVSWAKTVVSSHPNHNVIIVTHSYLTSSSTIEQSNGGYGDNSPQYVYDNLVKLYPNIRLVFCGHVGSHGYRTDTGVNGNMIYSFLQCYHENNNNPTRIFTINTANGTISTYVCCPYTDTVKTDGSQFTVSGVNWVQSSTTPPTSPAAPSSLSAAATGETSISLSWKDNSTNETGFKIERRTGGGAWSQIASPGAGVTSYADSGLGASTQYYYRVRATNAAGDSARSNEASATTFPAPPPAGPGTGILREVWTNVSGTATADLTGDARYPASPSSSAVVTIFEGPVNSADNYGTRLRGYVIAPLSGGYVFRVAGDDETRLLLNSAGEDPAGAAEIARVPGWTNSREWTKYAEQTSATVTLTAGKRYYVEVLHKEGTGGDNVAIMWRLPSGAEEAPIPGHRLAPWVEPEPRGPLGGAPRPFPGRVEAEDYDTGGEGVAYHDADPANQGGDYRTDGVDVNACSDSGGGFYVGWTAAGEWLEYTVTVAASATYDVSVRVASPNSGKSLRVEIGGASAVFTLPNTGSWTAWQTVTVPGMTLGAGTQVMRVTCETDGFDLNWIEVSQPTSPPPSDEHAPVVAFTSPADGDVVSGALAANAAAHDPDAGAADGDGISSVEFALLRGGRVLLTHTENLQPYDWQLDGALFADGAYVLRATASAADGGSASAEAGVILANGSSADLDTDSDLLPDWWEMSHGGAGAGLDPLSADSDSDGVPDSFADPDSDGATNLAEFLAGTDPLVASDFFAGAAGGGCSAGVDTGASSAPPILVIVVASWLLISARRRREASATRAG